MNTPERDAQGAELFEHVQRACPPSPSFYPKRLLQVPRGWLGGGDQNCPAEQREGSEILGVDFRQKFTALFPRVTRFITGFNSGGPEGQKAKKRPHLLKGQLSLLVPLTFPFFSIRRKNLLKQ